MALTKQRTLNDVDAILDSKKGSRNLCRMKWQIIRHRKDVQQAEAMT